MGSLFGSTTTPTPSTPTVGTGTQTNFFNALYGLGLTTNPADGTKMFNAMPAYQGQLTPNMSQMMAPNVWNSWQQQSPGQAQAQQFTQQAMQGSQQVNPQLQSIINGGAGPAGGFMNNLMQYGSGGPGGDVMKNLAQGYGPSLNFLNQYMNGQQVKF